MRSSQTVEKNAPDGSLDIRFDTAGGPEKRSLVHERKFSVPEAARMLGIGETKMRAMITQGEMPVVTIGGKVLLMERDLEEFLNGHYGRIVKAPPRKGGLPPLPKHVQESELLKKAG